MTAYTFKVTAISEYVDDVYYTESGLLLADSFSDAAQQLENVYGSFLVRILDLSNTGNLIINLPEEIVTNFENAAYETEVPSDARGNYLLDWNVDSEESKESEI